MSVKTKRQLMDELHERCARVLDWSVDDTKSFSFPTLREWIRMKDPDLAADMSIAIRQGLHR